MTMTSPVLTPRSAGGTSFVALRSEPDTAERALCSAGGTWSTYGMAPCSTVADLSRECASDFVREDSQTFAIRRIQWSSNVKKARARSYIFIRFNKQRSADRFRFLDDRFERVFFLNGLNLIVSDAMGGATAGKKRPMTAGKQRQQQQQSWTREQIIKRLRVPLPLQNRPEQALEPEIDHPPPNKHCRPAY